MNQLKNYLNDQKGAVIPVAIIIGVMILSYFYFGNSYSKKFIGQIKQLTLENFLTKNQDSKTEINPSSQAEVVITKDGFFPLTLTVAKGQQVTWVNKDKLHHKVIYYADASVPNFPSLDSEPLEPNDSFAFTFEKDGVFTYKNRLNNLTFEGTVIVK